MISPNVLGHVDHFFGQDLFMSQSETSRSNPFVLLSLMFHQLGVHISLHKLTPYDIILLRKIGDHLLGVRGVGDAVCHVNSSLSSDLFLYGF